MKRIGPSYGFMLIIFSASLIIASLFPALVYPAQAKEKPKLSLAAGICLSKAETLSSNGKYPEAVAVLEAFVNDPKNIKSGQADHPYFYFLLGNSYAMLLQNEKTDSSRRNAIKNYQAAVRLDPDLSAAWLNLAKCLYESEDYLAAANSFEGAWTHSDEKKAVHLYYAAVCYFQAGNNKKALDVFTALIKNHPDEIKLGWKETYVNILFSIEKYKTALPHVEELALKSVPPKQKKWQEILLQQYLNLEMDAKALSYAKFLTGIDPLEPKWWKSLTHIHLKKNQLEKGLAALVIYGYLTPMTEKETTLKADLYFSLDIPAKASLLYQELFKANNKPETLEKLTQSLTLAHDQDNALEWINKGLTMLEGKDVKASLMFNLMSARARILYMKKSWDDAAQSYESAAQYAKKPGQSWLMAGYSYLNIEKAEAAEKAFKKATAFKKQKEDALAAIKQIQVLKTQKTEGPI